MIRYFFQAIVSFGFVVIHALLLESKFKKLDDKVVSVLSDIKDEKKKIGSRVNSIEEHFIKFKDLVIDEINRKVKDKTPKRWSQTI